MAFKKKDTEVVTLVNPRHTSVIIGNNVIEFIDGKATVSIGTAEALRNQGIIK
jgi:hypothetical protein